MEKKVYEKKDGRPFKTSFLKSFPLINDDEKSPKKWKILIYSE